MDSVRETSVVAILCPAGWGLRNMVHSGVTSLLHKNGIATRVLARSRVVRDGEQEWGPASSGAELLDASVIRSERGHAALNAVLRASFARRHRISTYRIFNRWRRRHDGPWLRTRNAVVELLSLVGSREQFYSWQVRASEVRYQRSRDVAPIVRQLTDIRPTLVVSTNCQMSDEVPYLLAARELGVPTLGCIPSFDNLTTRSVLPVFDHYALWNERMRGQLLEYYPDRDPATVHITGTPQFDFHARADCRWSRDVTLERLGLRPADRYILWAANHYTHTPDEPDRVIALARQCTATPELREHRVVVRPHPLDDARRWEPGLADGRVAISWPWEGPAGVPRPRDQAKLVSTLFHADVCLNTASTMSLDAAAVGTPVVCVDFGDHPQGHAMDHFRPIVESGGVRLAVNLGELVAEIVAYVRDRSRDDVERRRLVSQECGPVDGRCAERVAQVIADIVNRRTASVADA